MSTFYERYRNRSEELGSLLCVGLDPDPLKIPSGYGVEKDPRTAILSFFSDILGATSDMAVAYKPNLAFFEGMGMAGWNLFEATVRLIREKVPGAGIIADAKRGDIGNTSRFYARAFFESFDCDAVTVNPYMGMDSLEPFMEYSERGVIVLGLTSNPGAAHFQMYGEPPLYESVVSMVEQANRTRGNLWLVVGATQQSSSLQRIRELAPGVPFLVPGVGAQGGSVTDVLKNAGRNVLINASRSILYSAENREGVVEKARQEARILVQEMDHTGLY